MVEQKLVQRVTVVDKKLEADVKKDDQVMQKEREAFSSSNSGWFVPLKFDSEDMPTVGQRLRTAAAFGVVYALVSQKMMKPLFFKLLSKHSQWGALMKREGTFNKSATDEVVYVLMTGIHHVCTAMLGRYAMILRQNGGSEDKVNALGMYSALFELGYEWQDFFLMALKQWPYENCSNAFRFLIVVHHSFGLLSFFMTGRKEMFNKDLAQALNPTLGVAGLSCLFYPLQQLSNLETVSGVKRALYLNVINTMLFAYVRFYLLPVKGGQFVKETFLTQGHGGESATFDPSKANLLKGAYGVLSIFNVLVMAGSVDKCKKYLTQYMKLVHTR